MDDHGGTTPESAGEARRVSTFFCRDCQQYFRSEPCSADGECAPCPNCQSDCYTVEFEQSERQRMRSEDTILSFFARIFLQLPSWAVREVDDLPPNPFEETVPRPPLSPQIGDLVRTYLRGDALQEHETDRQIWEHHLSTSGEQCAKALLKDVNVLLDMPAGEAYEAVNAFCLCEGQAFISPPSELIAWLRELKAFLE